MDGRWPRVLLVEVSKEDLAAAARGETREIRSYGRDALSGAARSFLGVLDRTSEGGLRIVLDRDWPVVEVRPAGEAR